MTDEELARRERLYQILILALAGALAAALALGVWQVASKNSAEDDNESLREDVAALEEVQENGQAAEDAARQALKRLTTYDYRSLDEDFSWIDEIGTAAFEKRYADNVAALKKIARAAKAMAEGEVVDSAFRTNEKNPDQVVVLAFVDQVIRDAEHKGVKIEEQRVLVHMVVEDGDWKVDSFEIKSGDLTE